MHADLTGRENLLLNSSLLGFTKKEAHARFDEIVSFAGLEDVIDEPLRTYSTGMSLRLAFSIAINLDPEILIVDEILAVGDQAFQQKCFARVQQFRKQGKTILAVSHAPPMLRSLCDRAIWLEAGRVVMDDSVERVLNAYGAPAAPVPPAR
jgi:ABC-type polysaccharide/polyol phosphate transport system ATPase subunit